MSEQRRLYTLAELQEMQDQQVRDWVESFPKRGDRVFVPSASGAHIDPFGLIDPARPGERSSFGRWELYADGFREAADRLVGSLDAGEMNSPPGAALIYPILFCYRHFLELQLKALVSNVLLSALEFSTIDEDTHSSAADKLSTKHGLRTLWETLLKRNPLCDPFGTDRTAFENLLFELDDHDQNSQAARYPLDTKGNQTLTRLSIVDLGSVKVAVDKIARYLRAIQDHLADELKARSETDSEDGGPPW